MDNSLDFQLLYATFKAGEVNNQNDISETSNSPPSHSRNIENCNIDASHPHSFNILSLSYRNNQLANLNSWDGYTTPIFIFSNVESVPINTKNIKTSLYCMANFITNRKLKNNMKKDILYIFGFGQVAWTLISFIYEVG